MASFWKDRSKKAFICRRHNIYVGSLIDFKNEKHVSMPSNAAGWVGQDAKLITCLHWQQASRDGIYEIHRNTSAKRYERLVH